MYMCNILISNAGNRIYRIELKLKYKTGTSYVYETGPLGHSMPFGIIAYPYVGQETPMIIHCPLSDASLISSNNELPDIIYITSYTSSPNVGVKFNETVNGYIQTEAFNGQTLA